MLKRIAWVVLLSVISSQTGWAVGSDKARYMGGTVVSMPENAAGRLDMTGLTDMVFTTEKGQILKIPWGTVESIEYGQRVSRRWKTAIFVSVFALFSKGRKHIITLTYKDSAGADQAVVFEFGKDVYRTALAALKAKSGQQITCQDEEARRFFGGSCVVVALESEATPSTSRPATTRAASEPNGSTPSGGTVGSVSPVASVSEAQPAPRSSMEGELGATTPQAENANTELSGRLKVLTDPAGADVYVGDLRIGSTTPDGLLVELPAGAVAISVRKAGYSFVERIVTVYPNSEIVLPLTLRASQ